MRSESATMQAVASVPSQTTPDDEYPGTLRAVVGKVITNTVGSLEPFVSNNSRVMTASEPEARDVTQPIRVYTDASVHNGHHGRDPSSSIGYAAVDANTTLLAIGADQVPFSTSPHLTEARAIYRGVTAVDEMDAVSRVRIVTDASNVKHKIRTGENIDSPTHRDEMEDVVASIRSAGEQFERFDIQSIERGDNGLAHYLAGMGHENGFEHAFAGER